MSCVYSENTICKLRTTRNASESTQAGDDSKLVPQKKKSTGNPAHTAFFTTCGAPRPAGKGLMRPKAASFSANKLPARRGSAHGLTTSNDEIERIGRQVQVPLGTSSAAISHSHCRALATYGDLDLLTAERIDIGVTPLRVFDKLRLTHVSTVRFTKQDELEDKRRRYAA